MMTWQEFEHEKDTLHGEINRMCVSDNITEIKCMCQCAKVALDKICAYSVDRVGNTNN